MVNNPDASPAMKKGATGKASRFHDNVPRFHQKITSNAAGKVTVAVLLSKAMTYSPRASAYSPLFLVRSKPR